MGIGVTGENADTEGRGAAILGPKIGNGFISNLYSFFDELTMDRWPMRSVGRIRGTLFEDRPDMVSQKRDELQSILAKVRRSWWPYPHNKLGRIEITRVASIHPRADDTHSELDQGGPAPLRR